MKPVVKDYKDIPLILDSVTCNDLKTAALTEKGAHSFDPKTYGHPDVRIKLNSIYNFKCAFCETDPTAGMTINVEHYRPKAKVTGEKNHPGYYWLGYEWSNLLLACYSCNNRKRSRFSIAKGGVRVDAPPLNKEDNLADSGRLLGENALIINPELIKDVSIHFTYDDTGKIIFISGLGKETIERTNLNRSPLIKARLKVLDKCLNGIMTAFDKLVKGLIDSAEIDGMIMARIDDLVTTISENEQYSEFARHCWLNFKPYIIDKFKSPQKERVESVYNRVFAISGSV